MTGMTGPPPRRLPAARSPWTRRAALTLYAHPFELAVVVMLGVSAARAGLEPRLLVEVLSGQAVALWVALNAIGLIATVVGLFGSADITGAVPNKTAAMRAIEKAGLYLIAGTEVAVIAAIEVALPWAQSWPSSVQLAAIAAAALLRAGAIRKAERIELETLERLSSPEYLRRLLTGHDGREDDVEDDEEEGGPR